MSQLPWALPQVASSEGTCPICQTPFEDPTCVALCWHIFSIECIQHWATTIANATCPLHWQPVTLILY